MFAPDRARATVAAGTAAPPHLRGTFAAPRPIALPFRTAVMDGPGVLTAS
ncbi:hypothetical protein [Streptomyces sp. SID2888]|nr:hypothetical protein [Streptomyces sp. SID2888]MYV50566.1 hypothetical protein [Streptomyces sp. SID2888]